MADVEKDAQNGDSGTKDRATVALVDAKVDGLKDLIRAEFSNIKEDVRALAAVVGDVIKQGVHIQDLERRVSKIESDSKDAAVSDRDYRRFYRPSQLLGAVAIVVSVVTLITQIHW